MNQFGLHIRIISYQRSECLQQSLLEIVWQNIATLRPRGLLSEPD